MKYAAAIAPTLCQAADLASFSHCLDFMATEYHVTWIDPLEEYKKLSIEDYRLYWQNKINSLILSHDIFIGFSLGGILLLENLHLFLNQNKTIILISTPCVLDDVLRIKLNQIIHQCNAGNAIDAIKLLNAYIATQPLTEDSKNEIENLPEAAARLSFGLDYVLHPHIVHTTTMNQVPLYQIVGADSKLVTQAHVIEGANRYVHLIPNAGQRVLEDNPHDTRQLIKQWLDLYDKKN